MDSNRTDTVNESGINNNINDNAGDRQGVNTFILTARRDFVENKKMLLLGVGTVWAIYILFGALLGYNGRGGGISEVMVCGFFATIFSCIAGSLAFSNLKTKEGRISTYMLPSTSLDKFMVRWIAVVPVLFIVIVAGFYLCDLSRILVCWLCDYPWLVNGKYMHVINVFGILKFEPASYYKSLVFLLASIYLFNQAVYLFGSVLWPRLSFIKTFVACWILQTVFGFVGIYIEKLIDWKSVAVMDESYILCTFAGIFAALAIGLYILTYYRFKRGQVVYKLL